MINAEYNEKKVHFWPVSDNDDCDIRVSLPASDFDEAEKMVRLVCVANDLSVMPAYLKR